MSERVPPQDIPAEASVLGSMMLDPGALADARGSLTADDFYRPAHQTIFKALCWMADKGQAVDLVTVRSTLQTHDRLELVGGIDYLVDMVQGIPTAANVTHYAETVRDKSRLRRLIVLAGELQEQAFSCDDPEELFGRAEAGFASLALTGAGGTMTLGEAARLAVERSERVERGEEPAGMSTGFCGFDQCSAGGLRHGEMVVVAAVTSQGKTALACRISLNLASAGKRVRFFSLEMPGEDMGRRVLATSAGVDGLRILGGRVGNQWDAVRKAQAEFADLNDRFLITDRPYRIGQIQSIIRRDGMRRKLPDVVVIDYLQLVPSEGRSRREEIDAVARGAQRMAQELGICVILVAQLSRTSQMEKRPPELRDLKESSEIEQAANGVILLHRPAGEEENMDYQQMWAKVAKWRNGMTTPWEGRYAIRLSFRPDTTDFRETKQETDL